MAGTNLPCGSSGYTNGEHLEFHFRRMMGRILPENADADRNLALNVIGSSVAKDGRADERDSPVQAGWPD